MELKLQSVVSRLILQLDPDVNPILRESISYGSHSPKIPNSHKPLIRLIPKPNKIVEAALGLFNITIM